MNKIQKALSELDKANDTHWTTDGLPRVETVRFLAKDQSIDRGDISKEAPGFTRHSESQIGAGATLAQGTDAVNAQGANGTAAPPQRENEAGVVTATAQPLKAESGAATQAPAAQPTQAGADDGEVQSQAVAETADLTFDNPELAAMEAEFTAAQDELAEIERAFVQANAIRDEARARVDRLLVARDALLPKQHTQNAITGYLAQQQELRARHAEQLRNDPAMLSPIDRSFARKVGRGMGRPTFFNQK